MKHQSHTIFYRRQVHFCILFFAFVLAFSCQTRAAARLSSSSLNLLRNETKVLTVTGVRKKVTWKSSDKKVAIVSKAGTVRGKSKGTAVITATLSNGKKLKCKVTVSAVIDCKGKLKGANNAQKIYHYLTTVNFTPEAAAAIVGNLIYESGGQGDVRLDAVEYSTGRGIGMCQWTDTYDASRRTRFLSYCSEQGVGWPNTNLRVQVNFLMKELYRDYENSWYFLAGLGYPASYRMNIKQFRKLKDVRLATEVFCANFERPRYADAGLERRIMYAQSVLSAS